MKTIFYLSVMFCLALLGGCAFFQASNRLPSDMQPERIQSIMGKVADWQLANPSRHSLTDWTHGALYAGMMEWAHMADSDKYFEALKGFGEKTGWQLGKRPYHADDHAVGQMYIDMYKQFKDPEMIQAVQKRFDWILANQPDTPLTHDKREHKERYNWCDALFMAPPVWVKMARLTGQPKYLDYMNKEWWATTDYLYDTQEHLYFRDDRYFNQQEANGEKVFWSRGNGWVFGGLVRVLAEMPEDYPDRHKYVKIYKEMAAKLVDIQPAEGLWHSSLLDPANFPKETSGSGFYCYGLAWGINHGHLNEKDYLPAVIKAWTGLVDCVHPDGKLGFVQPIGADPRPAAADLTEIYGVGSFLLAGSEVYKIAVRNGQKVTAFTVTNPGLFFRDSETLFVKGAAKKAVFDLQTNKLLLTQSMNGNLLFQTDLAPGQKKSFWVMQKPEMLETPDSEIATFCRFVPEREDDFAWENDLIAFRMYGPALWDEAVNSGIDCWLKRVTYPIINKWYGQMEEKTYHTDWGEGYDPYHVGQSAGCGGLYIIEGDQHLHSNVYDRWKVLANGPIRSVFELTYDKSWKGAGQKITETKRVTIDLGHLLCRFDCRFTGPDAAGIGRFAVGITTHDGKAECHDDVDRQLAYCWETIDGFGLGTGVLAVSPAFVKSMVVTTQTKDESHIYLYTNKPDSPAISYYTGHGWERAGDITTLDAWRNYLQTYRLRLDTPVKIEIETL